MEPEIKRLYRVQTINSILNLEASGGEWRKKKQQTKMKSRSCAAHVNYLLGWFHRLSAHKGMCGDGITGETCTIRKLNGAEKQQIVFSDLMLLYFPRLLEHVFGTDAA